MEMEHINENTIRVMIGNDDLADRGITFLDLLGNHKEVENFFYSILEEIDVEEEFQGSDAVTFQVLPKSDGLELFISKNTALDAENYENFNEMSAEQISKFIRKQAEEVLDSDVQAETHANGQNVVFELKDFESMVLLAGEVYLQSVLTSLYTFQDKYYLQVAFLEENEEMSLENEIAQLLEFATLSPVTTAVLQEYGKCLMERNALELMRYYFK